MILGQSDGLHPDPELFYVASLLHDLALTDQFRDYAPMPCFGARAGILANDWAGERGWPAHRCSTLADAISLHLNARVPAEHGPEAQLLQAGAGLDVIGLRHWELTPETVASVVERYPRHNMKRASHPGLQGGESSPNPSAAAEPLADVRHPHPPLPVRGIAGTTDRGPPLRLNYDFVLPRAARPCTSRIWSSATRRGSRRCTASPSTSSRASSSGCWARTAPASRR